MSYMCWWWVKHDGDGAGKYPAIQAGRSEIRRARDPNSCFLPSPTIPQCHLHTPLDARQEPSASQHMFNFGGELLSLPRRPRFYVKPLAVERRIQIPSFAPCSKPSAHTRSVPVHSPVDYQTLMASQSRCRWPPCRPARLQEAKTAACATYSRDFPFP